MDKYPSRKQTFLQLLILASVAGFLLVYNADPIEVEQPTLTVTSCKSPLLKLKLNGDQEPCLKHKLHTLYDRKIGCQVTCASKLEFPGNFSGSSAQEESDEFFIELDGIRPQICEQIPSKDLCLVDCGKEEDELNRVLNVEDSDKKGDAFLTANYWIIFYAWLVAAMAQNSIATLQDAVATSMVQDHVRGETFGQQRLWASVGWGLMAFIGGHLVDIASEDNLLYQYGPAFTIYSILYMADVFVVKKLEVN